MLLDRLLRIGSNIYYEDVSWLCLNCDGGTVMSFHVCGGTLNYSCLDEHHLYVGSEFFYKLTGYSCGYGGCSSSNLQYYCTSCFAFYTYAESLNTHTPGLITKFETNCGKEPGTSNWTQDVETWSCATCTASTTYKPAVTSFYCSRCNTNHEVAASGATSTTHKPITQYTTCNY